MKDQSSEFEHFEQIRNLKCGCSQAFRTSLRDKASFQLSIPTKGGAPPFVQLWLIYSEYIRFRGFLQFPNM